MQICECVQKKYTDGGCFADTFIRKTALGSLQRAVNHLTSLLLFFFNLCLKVEWYLFVSAPEMTTMLKLLLSTAAWRRSASSCTWRRHPCREETSAWMCDWRPDSTVPAWSREWIVSFRPRGARGRIFWKPTFPFALIIKQLFKLFRIQLSDF